jgi:hypothetical protein
LPIVHLFIPGIYLPFLIASGSYRWRGRSRFQYILSGWFGKETEYFHSIKRVEECYWFSVSILMVCFRTVILVCYCV